MLIHQLGKERDAQATAEKALHPWQALLAENTFVIWVAVDGQLYDPIYQFVAVIKGSSRLAEAHRFSAFLRGGQARAVLRRYGFLALEDAP